MLVLLLLLFAVQTAMASCAGCTLILGENWKNNGTPAYTSGQPALGLGVANVCGNTTCGTVGIVCSSGLPWNPNNFGGNPCYLHMTPGVVSVPNNGTGFYLPFGTPHQRLLISFPFRYTGSLSAGPNANFFLRINNNDTSPFGTDILAPNLDSTGHIVTQFGGNTTNALTVNTWQYQSWCVDLGTGSNGTSYWTVDGTNWLSATGLTAPGGHASNNLTLDVEYTGVTAMDFGPVIISDPGASCTAAKFYQQSDVYALNFVPTSNGVVAWAASALTNWQNVLFGSGNNNASNTNGQQDLYNLSTGSIGTITAQGILAQFQNDVAGDRIPLSVSTVSGVTSAGTVTNTLPLVGSYAATMVPVPGGVVPTQVGVKVNN